MDIGEMLYARKLERAAAKGGRGMQRPPERPPIPSPVLHLEQGLVTPLSIIVGPLLAEMRRVEADVEAIVPHTMARSATRNAAKVCLQNHPFRS
jgi:hypothetical protein